MDVSFTSEDNTAVLTCGRGVFKFPVYKDVYPDLPLEANILGEIDADVFLDAFRKVMPACAKTDSNPALTAVLLEPTGENLLMAATDRYRLATVETTWTPTDPCEPVLLPAWAVERFLRAAEGTVSLGWDDRVVSLASGVLRATGRRMQGEFPQWRALMPTVPCDVTVNTGALMGALKRAQLAAEQDSPVELSFTNGSLKVSAGYGNRAEDVLDTSYNGPGFTALFGVSRLMDGLAGCTDMVGFGFTEPLKPVWLQSGDFNYTVLPRRRI
jgi:DNA polymerase-3 subunit beta